MDFNPFSSYRFSARDEHERSRSRGEGRGRCAPWATLASTLDTPLDRFNGEPLPGHLSSPSPPPHGFFFALLLRAEPGSRLCRVARTPGETRRLCTGENDRLRLAHSWKRLPKRISKRRVLNREGKRVADDTFADSMTIPRFFLSFFLFLRMEEVIWKISSYRSNVGFFVRYTLGEKIRCKASCIVSERVRDSSVTIFRIFRTIFIFIGTRRSVCDLEKL